MNDIQHITRLRVEGRTGEAYEQARLLLAQYPDDRFCRISMAKCLKAIAEEAAQEGNADAVVEVFRQLVDLSLDEIGEYMLVNRFAWDIKMLFHRLKSNPDKLLKAADAIVPHLRNLSFKVHDKMYTLMLECFMKVRGPSGSPWPEFVDFMDRWGFDNFLPEDYERFQVKPGQSIPSVAERAYDRYYKTLVWRLSNGIAIPRRIEDFIERLSSLETTHPEYLFTLYHKAILLLKVGRRGEALETIRPYVSRKKDEFWVWDVLAEAVESPEEKLSCYCRSLLCKADPKFMGRVRMKMATLMHRLGYDSEARTEVRLLYRCYKENSWSMPDEAVRMSQEEWYRNAGPLADNNAFYRQHLTLTERYLYDGVPECVVLISKVNHEKGTCSYITSELKRGFFFFKGFSRRFVENEICVVRLREPVRRDWASTLLSCRRLSDISPVEGRLCKRLAGPLRFRPSGNGAEVGDVYLASGLVPKGAAEGDEVEVSAVISYSPARSLWSWKGIAARMVR